METVISTSEAGVALMVFAIAMVLLVVWNARSEKSNIDSFLVANRSLGWKKAALSIAVSWVWAPAIFIASLQAYTRGIAGAFWFIVPNVLCFFVFAPIALKLRRVCPQGYTMPQFILQRFNGHRPTHLAFLLVVFGYQLAAIIINAVAGGVMLNLLTGMNLNTAIVTTSLIALTYSLISGLKASVFTDAVQMLFILIVAALLIPWAATVAGGMPTILSGLGGVSGEYGSIFHPGVAYSFGIAMSLGLIAGPLCDQMFYQRAFAIKESEIIKTFVVGGLLFALVPLLFCIPGFIAAAPSVAQNLILTDTEMITPAIIGTFLPKWALVCFMVAAFCGLCSTLDSAFCAMSALGGIDIYRRYGNPAASNTQVLRVARLSMFALAILGTAIALLKPQLLWIHLIYGALASAGFVPIVCSIYSKKLPKEGATAAILVALIVSVPLSIYANITGNVDLIVASALSGPLCASLICGVAIYFFGVPVDAKLVSARATAEEDAGVGSVLVDDFSRVENFQ